MVPVSGKFDEHQASTRQPHPNSLQVSGLPIDREDPKLSQASQGISEDGAQALDLPLKPEGRGFGVVPRQADGEGVLRCSLDSRNQDGWVVHQVRVRLPHHLRARAR